ncbi:DUF47 family protein [Cohnella zeiphila]|uniref:DUF47 domain-containing protein n=1 Tax=Cohnella zeiphila TaxID=2761120 RepID=A0A7X0VV97_9BACL|nr:DUF47 domain-containing protein [Cohnella zeiphila]
MFRKKDIFFKTLEEMADLIVEAAERFASAMNGELKNVGDFAVEMKEFEHKGDQLAHVIFTELNKTFITPIEREDILELTSLLDDVLDGIEANASRFDMYQVTQPDAYIRKFGDVLRRSALEIKSAIYLLTQKKLLAIQTHCVQLNELENEGDDLMRQGIKHLFQDVKDPIELIKLKDLYERLEQTTDSCEDVANILQSIIMRNS